MNIYDELKKDHQEVKALLKQLVTAQEAEDRRSLIEKIKEALIPHSRAEEAVLYNSLRDLDQATELIRHSYQEHIKAETLLRGLQVTEAVALNWQSGVEKLAAELNHHIHEEEELVFAAAKKMFAEEEARQMRVAFMKLKSEYGSGVVSSQVRLMANLMPQRLREGFSRGFDEKRAS